MPLAGLARGRMRPAWRALACPRLP